MTDIRAKLTGLCEAFNAHDLDRIMTFFAEDSVLEMPRGPHAFGTRFKGKEEVRRGFALRFEGLPNVQYADAEHFADADRQTGMSTWTLTGTTHDRRRIEVQGLRLLHLPGRPDNAKGRVLEDRRRRLTRAARGRASSQRPCATPLPSEDQRQQADDDKQADQENDSDRAADELEHGDSFRLCPLTNQRQAEEGVPRLP